MRQFIIDSLRAMNYDVPGIGDDTELGPRGADPESLALAELAIRVEDETRSSSVRRGREASGSVTGGRVLSDRGRRIGPAAAAG